MGIENFINNYKLTDGTAVNVIIYDTAGQEKYRALSKIYYKKANCCLLVYDITNRKTFEECKYYFNKNIREMCNKDIIVILLGNKTDLEEKREVPSEEGAGFGVENNYIFMETSCMKNTNVANAFETLIEMTNIETKKRQKLGEKLNLKGKKRNKKKFC